MLRSAYMYIIAAPLWLDDGKIAFIHSFIHSLTGWLVDQLN